MTSVLEPSQNSWCRCKGGLKVGWSLKLGERRCVVVFFDRSKRICSGNYAWEKVVDLLRNVVRFWFWKRHVILLLYYCVEPKGSWYTRGVSTTATQGIEDVVTTAWATTAMTGCSLLKNLTIQSHDRAWFSHTSVNIMLSHSSRRHRST